MPKRGGGLRKKHRTHKTENEDELKKIPKSFVIKRGNLTPSVKELVSDWRDVMAPYSAMRLKENKKNKLKDFISVAGVFGVTHVMTFSQSSVAPYWKIARLPAGPTLTFRVHEFTLASDIRSQQKKSRVSPNDFMVSPLVVLNGFRDTGSSTAPLKLMTTVLGNMFPTIDVNSVSSKDCRRVVLFNYDKLTGVIEVRHYGVIKRPSGVSQNIKKLIRLRNNPNKLLDLGRKKDVSEYILEGCGHSESEGEDTAEASVPDKSTSSEGPSKLAISMHEIGPRMRIQLVKVEEEVSDGKVLFHQLIAKTPEELAVLEEKEGELKSKRKREAEKFEKLTQKRRKMVEEKHKEIYPQEKEGEGEEERE